MTIPNSFKPMQRSKGKLPLLSLFCGPGGLDLGFRKTGFNTVLALDNDVESINTFRLNHPYAKVNVRDVGILTLEELDKLAGTRLRPVGVLGGPPCQSFSISNVHQTDDDPRHNLPEIYAKILRKLNKRDPISFFIFENVPGLLKKKYRDRYEKFKNLFEKAGFTIFEAMLDAKHYGIPQVRPRIFIVGINKEIHPNKKWIPPRQELITPTVRDAIYGLPEPEFNAPGLDPNKFPVHPNHWCMVPRSPKFKSVMLREGQMHGRSFRTLSWDKPSWAVAYGNREVHVHPNGHRRLSVYEAMLLQSFPKSYRLTGNISAQIRLISEAVPPRLAWHIAKSIRAALEI